MEPGCRRSARRSLASEDWPCLWCFFRRPGETYRTPDSQTIADALASLSPDHRQVIVETYYLGRSVAEAASTLGIPAATVKSRTFDALKALKLALQERI